MVNNMKISSGPVDIFLTHYSKTRLRVFINRYLSSGSVSSISSSIFKGNKMSNPQLHNNYGAISKPVIIYVSFFLLILIHSFF